MSGRHAEPGRHAGQPEPRPWEILVSVGVTLLLFAAVAAYLVVRLHW